jgi:predicted DNA-binding transcriptional regulator YafY
MLPDRGQKGIAVQDIYSRLLGLNEDLLPTFEEFLAKRDTRKGEDYLIKLNIRTVQRDLQLLEQVFHEIDVYKEDKKNLYRWGFRNQLLFLMDRDLALTFNLADQYLRPVLSKRSIEHLEYYFCKARDRLKINEEGTRKWIDKVRVIPNSLLLQKPQVKDSYYDELTRAVLDERIINLTYQSLGSRGNKKNYDFHPYAIIFRDPVHLLVGVKEGEQGVIRQLRFDRIKKLRVYSDRPSNIPIGFKLEKYISESIGISYGNEPEQLKLRVSGVPLGQISDTPLGKKQSIEYDADTNIGIVTVNLRITQDLEQWLLANSIQFYGREDSLLEVLKPEYLRERIKSNIKRLSKIYQ